jgi:hypothetical protein
MAVEPAAEFPDIQLGDASDCEGISHLHMGFHSTPQVGGMQVDYLGYKIWEDGPEEPSSACPGGFAAAFNSDTGQVELSWSSGAVDSYTIRRDGAVLQEGIPRATTTLVDADPSRPSATYELVGIVGGAPADCLTPSVTVTTVVCPELSCAADRETGTVTLDWTPPEFFTATAYTILRNGAEVGNAAGDATSFSDGPPPGEYTYELAVASDPAGACVVNAFCDARLFTAGAIEIKGHAWDDVVVGGVAEIVTTDDGVKSLHFPGVEKTAGDVASFGVRVNSLGDGGIGGDRFRVELRARYDNEVRIVNRALAPESHVHFNLSRTGVSNATDEAGATETVEQVPSPGGGPTVDSASSTIVNTDTVGLLLAEGLNLIEIQPVDGIGAPHADQLQIFELRIGPFAAGLDAEVTGFPCPSTLSCARRLVCGEEPLVELSWRSAEPHAYEIERDGQVIAEIPAGETTTFTDEPGFGSFTYTLRATDADECPDLSCDVSITEGVPDAEGFIRDWLILGPLDWGCVANCANPGVMSIQTDYLAGTSGGEQVTEEEIFPVPGQEIALGPQATVRDAPRGDINPGRPDAAAWFAYYSPQSLIDANIFFGGDPGDNYMLYGVSYVNNTSGEDLVADLGVTSDDSVEVYVNDESVHVNNVARGVDLANLDPVFDVRLLPGLNRILVKVFEGGADTGFAVRIHDEFGLPITEGLAVSLCPEIGPPLELFVRGDADASGQINITDAIFLLGYLFQGTAAPPCMDAADADGAGDGAPNITDAIYLLGYLFQGTAGPPAPAPAAASFTAADCGADPTPDDGMDCASFPPCQ